MVSSGKGNGRKRKRDRVRGKQEEPSSKIFPSFGRSPSSLSSAASSSSSSPLFLTQDHPGFEEHVRDHYKGFVHCAVDDLQPRDFHEQARASLERLRDANYYQYDVVMAGGKHSSRTFVKRTLVGNPGITYKYLGLRLFAHAWSGPGVSPLMKSIGEMNQRMIRMTEQFPNHKNCDYNLTLINYMEPTIRTKVGFKEEANYGMGKVSVSWHADSSLEIGSSIGVYHCLPTQRSTKWDWRIALRPSPNSGAIDGHKSNSPPAKPVVVSTKDGDAYFLLGDFNETHQHCVLAGSVSNRISSTHRVAVTQEDTYDYILKRVKIARKRFRLQMEAMCVDSSLEGNGPDAKVIRYCQRVLTEVETEWIAQYWLQGAQHDKMHTWWQRPMKTLEAYWQALEAATWKLFDRLRSGNQTVPVDVVRVLINEFKTRQSLREQWDERRSDKIYQRRIAEEYRPVARPDFGDGCDANRRVEKNGTDGHRCDNEETRLPKDLTLAINVLQELLKKRVDGVATKPKMAEKDALGRSNPNQPNRASVTAVGKNPTHKVRKTNSSGADPKVDPPTEKRESDSKKKKRKPKKKRRKKT